MCHDVAMSARPRLPWPTEAPVVPVEPLRPVLEALSSLAVRHPEDVTLLPTLVDEDGTPDESADPPPALEQILEEFGGIEVCGRARLDLLADERSDLGPYTLLGDPTSYYPLHEGSDVAIILAVDEDGAPGAVYGIGEDLALTLAARDLGHFLERWLHALTETLTELDAGGPAGSTTGEARADAAERLLCEHLLTDLIGREPDPERTTVPVVPVADAGIDEDDLPEGAIAVADLRDAPLGAAAEVVDADLPGDPLEVRLGFSHGGLVITVIDEEETRS